MQDLICPTCHRAYEIETTRVAWNDDAVFLVCLREMKHDPGKYCHGEVTNEFFRIIHESGFSSGCVALTALHSKVPYPKYPEGS